MFCMDGDNPHPLMVQGYLRLVAWLVSEISSRRNSSEHALQLTSASRQPSTEKLSWRRWVSCSHDEQGNSFLEIVNPEFLEVKHYSTE